MAILKVASLKIGFCLYTPVMWYSSLHLIFKANLKLESGNRQIQYGHQAAILKVTLLKINRLLPIYTSIVPQKFGVDIQSQTNVRVWKPKIQDGCQAVILIATSLKINRLLPMATINMHMKLETEIPKQTWLTVRKPCHLQMDRWTDGQTDKVIPVYPPPTLLGGDIILQWVRTSASKVLT